MNNDKKKQKNTKTRSKNDMKDGTVLDRVKNQNLSLL